MANIEQEKEKALPQKLLLHQVITVLISTVITLVGLYEALETKQACYVYWAFCIMLVITAFVLRKRYPQQFRTLLLNSGAILLVTVIYLCCESNKVDGSVWYDSLEENVNDELKDLISRADSGNGLAQAELSDYYHQKRDYEKAIEYARKAANNGNAHSFMRIAWYNLYGLGCKVDIQECVNNILSALRLERIDCSPILKVMEEKGFTLTPTDSLKLKKRIDNIKLFDRLYRETDTLRKTDGVISAVKYIEKYRTVIEDASIDGYRPATALLYACEFERNPQGSKELSRLAHVLYQASYIPTQVLVRPHFFRSYYNDRTYSLYNFKNYIKDNDYVFLSFGDDMLTEFLPESFTNYSNRALLNEYELFRAQYDWVKGLKDGSIPSVLFFYPTPSDPSDYKIDEVGLARELLRRNIAAVQERMDSPAERDTINYDYDTNLQVTIGMDTPLSVSHRQNN